MVTISSWKPYKLPCTELSRLLGRPEQHTTALGLRQNFVLLVLELGSKMTMSAELASQRPPSLPCRRPPSRMCSRGPPSAGVLGVLSGLGPPKQPHFNATASGKAQHPNPVTACAGGMSQPLAASMLACSSASASWALMTGQVCPGGALCPDWAAAPPSTVSSCPEWGSSPACPPAPPPFPDANQHPLPGLSAPHAFYETCRRWVCFLPEAPPNSGQGAPWQDVSTPDLRHCLWIESPMPTN